MKLHEMKSNAGTQQRRKRVGRGDGSGTGGTCGRGHKGQKSRAGASMRPHFEGGQIPLFRRLPKRGFKSPNHKTYILINVDALEETCAADDVVDLAYLQEHGLVGKDVGAGLKVLANGEISKALTVKATKFSASAKSKIEAAGGTCELVD